ncbi:MAG TPA: hypothetical protein VES20_21340 [Bryobacteraceae bacterium]|nr:hypothetical protein [Bryobacteraceae bacterium]
MNAMISGATAAVVLTAMHECTRKNVDEAPRADLLGMRAIAKAAESIGSAPPDRLRTWALGGDLVANSLYYGMAVALAPKAPVVAGAFAGCAAAAGLVFLPGPLGLGEDAVNRTRATEALGASMYILAGFVAGCTYRWLDQR